MERVLGVGGIFFKSKDPSRLRRWYQKHLGLAVDDFGGAIFSAQKGDVTVWSAFDDDSTSFKPSRARFMVNFRVENLDRMLAQLRKGRCKVDPTVQDSEFGRFGWVMDPDGNRVELWEPPKKKAKR